MTMTRLLADPCGAKLVPGLFGTSEGMLARLKSVLSCDYGSAGYLLWCPRYHNGAWAQVDQYSPPFTAGTPFSANLFGWGTDNPDAHPAGPPPGPWQGFGIGNSFADGLSHNSSASFPDPAWKLLSDENAIVLDARTLSACIRLAYFGPMFSSAGQVGFIQDIPLSIIKGNTNPEEAKEPSASVNDLFKLATRTQRLGTETLEVVMRHSPGSELFQSSSDPAITTHLASKHPTPEYIGTLVDGPAPKLGDNADNFSATVFGFVWKNVNAPAALSFELVKNIEWRPSLDSGFQAVKPESVASVSFVQQAQDILDKTAPNWRAHTADAASSAAASLSRMAFTGVTAAMLSRAARNRVGFEE